MGNSVFFDLMDEKLEIAEFFILMEGKLSQT